MRHGIGSKAQHGVLLAAGVEHLWTPAEVVKMLSESQVAPLAWRAGDTVVMVQPDLLNLSVLRKIAAFGAAFEVVGHGPIASPDDAALKRFRRLSPMVDAAVEKVNRGGNVRYKQPTEEQAKVINAYWHGTMKPSEFMPLIKEMMDEPGLRNSAVRDWIIRWTGNSKRDPNADGKTPFRFR